MENTIAFFVENESEVRSYCRKFPVVFDKALNSEIFDVDGKRYIDFLSVAGSMNYGHNNPFIKKEILNYLSDDRIINALDFHTTAKSEFFELFVKEILKPRDLDYRVMCCGPTGTNAVEAAIKLARKNTGRTGVFAFSGAFHGMTLGALSLTTERKARLGGGIPLTGVTHIPYDNTGFDSIKYLKWALEDDHSGIDIPAAIILETVQAEGGVNVAGVEWLKEIRKICDYYNILLIVDDIQVGNGRTGRFFSFERAEIVPDMVVLSKSISGFGSPMAILLIKPQFDVFEPAEHNGTFRGNQLAFIGGAAGIKYFNAQGLAEIVQRKANLVETFIVDRILPIDNRIVYRGIGLIWGIDFKGIDSQIASKCVRKLFEKGLICEVAGSGDSVIKILPPLTIDDDTLLEGLSIVQEAITELIDS